MRWCQSRPVKISVGAAPGLDQRRSKDTVPSSEPRIIVLQTTTRLPRNITLINLLTRFSCFFFRIKHVSISTLNVRSLKMTCIVVSVRQCEKKALEKNFEVPPAVKNNTEENTVVTVMCMKTNPYVLIGQREVTCQHNGSWSQGPECRKCGKFLF